MSDLVTVGHHNAILHRVTGDDGDHIIRFGWTNQETPKKYCQLYFKIIDGEFAGRTVIWKGYYTPKAWKRTVESLKYAGFKGDKLEKFDEQNPNQIVDIEIEHEEYQNDEGEDKIAVKVAWVNRVGGGVLKVTKPLSTQQLREFSAQMQARLVTVEDVSGEAHDPAKAKPTGSNGSSRAGDAPPDEEPPPEDFHYPDPTQGGVDDDLPF